jgi:ferric-chelate reductase
MILRIGLDSISPCVEINFSAGVALILVVFATATKGSPLGVLAGLSYEKINAFHRWMGRLIVGIFLGHGILEGYTAVTDPEGETLQGFLKRHDVWWGFAAFGCLFFLITLYPSCLLR